MIKTTNDKRLMGHDVHGLGTRALLGALAFAAALFAGQTAAEAQWVIGAFPREVASGGPPLPETMETARGMAMGLGARASATGTSGLAYNAAGLSIGRNYHIATAASYEPQAERFSIGASLVDSQSGPVNMGTNFRYIVGNGNDGHSGMDGRIALGLPLGEHFAVGATGRYMSLLPEGQEGGSPLAEQVTLDASIRITPVPGLHFAALGYNLIDVGTSLIPIQVGGSASYTIDSMFTLAFDMLADLSSFTNDDGSLRPEAVLGAGAEFFTGEVPIRAGYVYDTGRDLHYVSVGSGWMNQELGIELSLRQQVTGPMDTWLLASFRYQVQ